MILSSSHTAIQILQYATEEWLVDIFRKAQEKLDLEGNTNAPVTPSEMQPVLVSTFPNLVSNIITIPEDVTLQDLVESYLF